MVDGVKIPIEALDQFSKVFDKAEKELDQLKADVKNNSDAIKKSVNFYTELNSKVDLVKTGMQMLGATYQALVGDTMEYANTVRQLSLVSGASAEDTSRLIQMTDDFGLELSTLEQAAKGAAQKGIALTTEKLAEMADEYNALADPVAQNTYLLDNFGRSGLEMAKVLSQGSQAIRDGAAAIADNMVLTKAQVDQARQLEIQLDNLNDSWAGIKNTVGNAVIPVLAEAAKTGNLLLNWVQQMNDAIEKHSQDVVKSSGSYQEYYNEMKRAAEVSGQWNINEMTAQMEGLGAAEAEAARNAGILTEQQYNLARSGAPEAVKELGDQADGAALPLKEAAQATQDFSKEMEQLKEKTDAVTEAQGKLAEAQKSFAENYGDKVAGALDKAGIKGGKYEDALAAIDKQYGTSLVNQKKANDNLNAAIENYKKTGDVKAFSQAISENGQEFNALDKSIQNAEESLRRANQSVEAFKEKLKSMNGMTITMEITTSGGSGEGPGSAGGGGGGTTGGQTGDKGDIMRASGGPVLAGGSYIVGERGPEMFVPSNSGTIIPAAQTAAMSAGVTINGNIVLPGVTNAQQFMAELGRINRNAKASGVRVAGGR